MCFYQNRTLISLNQFFAKVVVKTKIPNQMFYVVIKYFLNFFK